jgi:uncharacterized damage-inducible protein DinB
MPLNQHLANRLEEVLLNGKWIANTNVMEQISAVSWEQATQSIENLNTIAQLTFHLSYYLKGLNQMFDGGTLNIQDKYSFDMPEIESETDWVTLVNEFESAAKKFIKHVESMNEQQLNQPFVKEEYGSYWRNIEAQIEHSYYHLGQISLIRKLLENRSK